MKYNIYAVHDIKAEAYMTPFFMNTDGQAKRSFQDALGNPELPFGKHPADYTLFKIGEFSDHNGAVQGNTPESLGNALEFIELAKKGQQPQLELPEIGDTHEVSNGPPVQPSTPS